MRKILFYVLLVTCSVRLVYGATGTSRLFSTGKDNVFEIGSEGEVVSKSSGTFGGTLTVTGNITTTNGLITIYDGDVRFTDVPAVSSITLSDSNSRTLTTNTTTLYAMSKADITSNIGKCPRNVNCLVLSTSIVNGDTFTGTLILGGWNAKGVETSETINISTVSANGNVAWAIISTYTATKTSANFGDWGICIGLGAKLGLSNDLISASDVFMILEDTTQKNPGSATINTTYDTIIPENVADDSLDYTFGYKAKSK